MPSESIGADVTSRSPALTNDQSVTPAVSATRSSGSRPWKTGSRKIRFATASILRTASRSASVSVRGRRAWRFRVREISAVDGRRSRRTRVAPPCARLKWCAARRAARSLVRPGAWTPFPYPRNAPHQGSLSVVHVETRSPSAPATRPAYSANRCAVSRSGQPPASSSSCGRSQW
ncbi:hypothetical protein AN221_01775 [Streptomyces nanshensis]|uniref:Uncharacterized protein n=1 Tax=Streptomyces nanshensis TaxID=518642 RepID=A0A1E7M1P0_9ACTN|nr:hypothetical protein AN221_01775 [Streptomyces nanshensis]